jgi:hypothetical protein
MAWVFLRPHADFQRLYGLVLGFAGLLVGGVLLLGPMSIPASAGQVTWRRPPRWPAVVGVVVIALAAGSRRLQQERRRINGLPLAWWRTPTE